MVLVSVFVFSFVRLRQCCISDRSEGGIGILLIATILISSLMAAVYIWRVIESAYFGTLSNDSSQLREAPLPLLLGAWTAALANIYFGLSPDVPLDLAQAAANILLGNL